MIHGDPAVTIPRVLHQGPSLCACLHRTTGYDWSFSQLSIRTVEILQETCARPKVAVGLEANVEMNVGNEWAVHLHTTSANPKPNQLHLSVLQ